MKKYLLLISLLALSLTSCGLFNNNEDKPINKPEYASKYAFPKHLDGEYYGDYFRAGVGNYYIHLSTKGFKSNGMPWANTAYYRIDLYGEMYDGPKSDIVPIPAGTYTLDKHNTCAKGTFTHYNSKRLSSDQEGYFDEELLFDEGKLVVEQNKMTLTVLIGNIQHVVTYEGEPTVADKSEEIKNSNSEGALSTLTEDYTTNLENHECIYVDYDDYYNTRHNNWVVAIWPNSRKGDHLQFDIMTDMYANEFTGTYTVGSSSSSYSFLKGFIGGDNTGYYMEGSWYYTEDGTTMAPFVDGTLTIAKGEGHIYTIDFSVVDDRGNKIDGSWQGYAQSGN